MEYDGHKVRQTPQTYIFKQIKITIFYVIDVCRVCYIGKEGEDIVYYYLNASRCYK